MLEKLIVQVEKETKPLFDHIQQTVETNQRTMLEAFKEVQIGDHHFSSTDGYGYDDSGRDNLEALYAIVFGAEDALVRPQIVSGTHAISTALYGLLFPGDELLYITGSPYDTLEEIIGKRGNTIGSLKDYGVTYNEVRSEEHTSELQSRGHLVCRLLLEKKKNRQLRAKKRRSRIR